jgi:hypothetical protein
MYSINSHTLQFNDDYDHLLVVDHDDEVVADFDLTQNSPPYEVKVVGTSYDISATTCTTCVEVFAIDVEAKAGSVSVDGASMTGLGIIDLRDTGRFGSSVTFDLAACPVILHRQSGAFALRFSSSNGSSCFAS